jgi:hypothetical protein
LILDITGLKKTIKAIWTFPVTNSLEYTRVQDEKIEETKEVFANSYGQLLDVDNLDNFEYWILKYGLAFNLLIFI